MLSAFAIAKEDTGKITILLDLSNHCGARGDLTRAIQYAMQAVALTDKKEFEKKKGSAYLTVGNILQIQTKYAEAETYFNKALVFFRASDNKKGMALTNHLWGMNYYSMERYPEAVSLLFNALKFYEELGDKDRIAAVLRGLAASFNNQDKTEEALGYSLRALKMTEELNNKVLLAQLYNEVGINYSGLNNYDEAIRYHTKALQLNHELGKDMAIWALAFNYHTLGLAYLKKGDDKYNSNDRIAAEPAYREALKNFLLGYKEWRLIEKAGTFPLSVAAAGDLQIDIGTVYYKLGDIANAKSSIRSGLPVCISENSKAYISNGYFFLSRIDSIEGNFTAAYEHYKLYDRYQDSISSDEGRKKIEQYKNQYIVDKKEKGSKRIRKAAGEV